MKKRKAQKETTPSIDRQQLVETLDQLRPAVASNDAIPDFVCFHFDGNRVFAHNGRVFISTPTDILFQGAVPAEDLLRLLKKMSGERVRIKEGDSELRLSCGKVRAGLRLMVTQQQPPTTKKWNWQALPEGFMEAIRLASFSISTDVTRPELTCVHCLGKSVMTSDDHRITKILLGDKAPEMAIPGHVVKDLCGYGAAWFCEDGGWMHFATNKNKGLIFSVVKINNTGIEQYEQFLKVKGHKTKLPREAMLQLIDRALVMSEGKVATDYSMSLRLRESSLTSRAEKNSGWIEETVNIDYDGPAMDLYVNPLFMREILQHAENVTVGERLLLFRAPNIHHVLCQWEPNKEEQQ